MKLKPDAINIRYRSLRDICLETLCKPKIDIHEKLKPIIENHVKNHALDLIVAYKRSMYSIWTVMDWEMFNGL